MEAKDKVCGVVFDAISLKSGLYYNITKDQVVEDLGQYGRSEQTAQYAMVFMVKGLARKWKQALAYFFFHSSINPTILKSMVSDCLRKLK